LVGSDVPEPEAGREAVCDQAEAVEPVEAAEDKAIEEAAEDKTVEEEAAEDKTVEEEAAEAEETDSDREAELAEKQRQIEALVVQNMRLRADFENFRRRNQQKLEEYSQRGAERLINKLLPVLDDFDRALEASSGTRATEGLAQGVSMVRQALLDALYSEGLSPIESVGLAFDPNYHEAVALEECAEGRLYVVEEYQKGYIFGGRVLRPAKVKVGPSAEPLA
jgi:molecular chaperone GrpE